MNYEQINPILKKNEICVLLDELRTKYSIHDNPNEDGYEYLEERDICITVENDLGENNLYIDLENNGEFTLTFSGWHAHYVSEIEEYDHLVNTLKNLILNHYSIINFMNEDKWLGGYLSNEKLTNDINYIDLLKKIPSYLRKKVRNINVVFWNGNDNFSYKI